ncbi:MAG: phosphate/phosphite/phosphonate ABC transporter substrate-binding protein [Casimicrobiaceae bacterium]|nr:phosphate/phosphite/phosphonate ABC transporter substrate-binding protein [Casimicrobiaceae bacterium]MCX8098099.1 phosphate/phosphite/phosphonate ABC transporter substrate-binding protein [Casimicrobiaceae bacterium]MDW8311637.1 phosphate/phosphite/phosphonate ABC transporter substrate-binding protein [Burkholderiales bacterium]
MSYRKRREVIAGALAAFAGGLALARAMSGPAQTGSDVRAGAPRGGATETIRFGTTPVFLDEQVGVLERWQRLLGRQLGRRVVFISRARYREMVDALLADEIELAWLCGYPLVRYAERLKPVLAPRYDGAPRYRSLLIQRDDRAPVRHVSELQGSVFAYSDPLSNSGYLVPRVELIMRGHDPERFFRRTFFTYGHRKVIEAVREGLAEAGAVDGYVWDTLAAQQPRAVKGTRVVWRSRPFVFPPIVVRRSLDSATERALVAALRSMGESAEGGAILAALNLEGFSSVALSDFADIASMAQLHARRRQGA